MKLLAGDFVPGDQEQNFGRDGTVLPKRRRRAGDVESALGFELDQVALDIAACKQLRRRCIRNWKKQAR
jgi:hypothetical protein